MPCLSVRALREGGWGRRATSNHNFLVEALPGALAEVKIKPEVKETARIPANSVDLDDVQNVSTNFNVLNEVMAEIGEE